MSRALHGLHRFLALFGLDVVVLRRALLGLPPFARDLYRYLVKSRGGAFPIRWKLVRPMLTDRFESAGSASGHYFHQDLWAARKIFKSRPRRHVDIGSRIDGFVSHVLTFMTIEVVDIRPLNSDLSGLEFIQEDATSLARFADSSLESLSSLHAVEHFGLGRYGDAVDPEACFRAMRNMARVLKPGGRLYFAVPIGVERVEFNAHRVFAPSSVLKAFSSLTLISFSAVDDDGRFDSEAKHERYLKARFACGLFEFTK